MKDSRQRLRQATNQALERLISSRQERDLLGAEVLCPGDILALRENTEEALFWVVLEGENKDNFRPEDIVLLVPADLNPSVGSQDVATSADDPFGDLTLRCGFAVRLPVEQMPEVQRVGVLAPVTLERAREREALAVSGASEGSVPEQETDFEPAYQDWLEEVPARAQQRLLKLWASGPESSKDRGHRLGPGIFPAGVDALSGRVLEPIVSYSEAISWMEREAIEPSTLQLLQHVHRTASRPHLGLPVGVQADDFVRAGWAVVFHEDEVQETKEALQPLIEHRRLNMGAQSVKILQYSQGETWIEWLSKHGVGPGSVEPQKVPYYLILVGEPTKIPYAVETILGVEYAVGRLSFETAEEYLKYAIDLVDYESNGILVQDPTALFFKPQHFSDPASQHVVNHLVKSPLDEDPVLGIPGTQEAQGFETLHLQAESATKQNLQKVFQAGKGEPQPSFIFATGHGLVWPKGHEKQRAHQGELLCQEWATADAAGPQTAGFGAADLVDNASVRGMVVFLRASLSAGTPAEDTVWVDEEERPQSLAPEAFVSRLPQRLLAHPQGAALAFIGLIDRVWISGEEGLREEHLQPLRDFFSGTLNGQPMGHVLRQLKKGYAASMSRLHEMLQKKARGAHVDEEKLVRLWSARNEYRSYVLLGDPAARIKKKKME